MGIKNGDMGDALTLTVGFIAGPAFMIFQIKKQV
jgi:hypothetical protein